MTTKNPSASAEPARNEAAERLLLTLTTRGLFSSTRVQEAILRQVDKALAAERDLGDKAGYAEGYRHGERAGRAAERRATVERIRERSVAQTWLDRRENDEDRITLADLHAILDEEAAR
jgi:hypothetical protein